MPLQSLFTLCPLACSGSGGGSAIRENIWIGYFTAALGAVFVLALLYDAIRTHRITWHLMLAASLFLAHPRLDSQRLLRRLRIHKTLFLLLIHRRLYSLMRHSLSRPSRVNPS